MSAMVPADYHRPATRARIRNPLRVRHAMASTQAKRGISEAPTASFDDTAKAIECARYRELLEQASLLFASYGRLMEKAGYPFAHPPGALDFRRRLDDALFPEINRRN